MEKKFIKWWHALLIVIISVGMATGMTFFISTDLTSLEVFAPMEKRIDFQVSDIYNAVEEERQGREQSPYVVVVNVDGYNRDGVLDIVDAVSQTGPKAIGLDVFFSVEKEDNTRLINTIMNTKNLVSAIQVELETDSIHFRQPELSFYDKKYHPEHVGYINLDINHSWDVIRTFQPCVYTLEGEMIPSMPLALAMIADSMKALEAIQRSSSPQIIDFTGNEIKVINANRLKNENIAARLKDKVVLIGALSDNKDIYRTPLNDPTAGVLVHAYTLHTILNESYIQTRPESVNWLIAIGIGLLLVIVLLFANEWEPMKYFLNFTIRILLFVFMYMLVRRGCEVYANAHVYADYTKAILMLGLSTLAFDIVYAIYGFILQICNKKSK